MKGLFFSVFILAFSVPASAIYNWASNPGNGTAGNPYQISTPDQLASIGSNAALLDDYFILTADIDMTGYPFTNSPIAPDTNQSSNDTTGENRFSGSLDGRSHRISHLTITRPGTSFHIGLIGLTAGTTWQVQNLALDHLCISVGNSSQYIGGVVSRSYGGSISGCCVSGSITGGTSTQYMGGLAGLASGMNLSNCYLMCTLTNGTGSSQTGGAVGNLSAAAGQLVHCYSAGTVSSLGSNVGGLVGALLNGADVVDSYFLSTAAPDNGKGTPKTINELKSILTYPTWDFIGATSGNAGVWRMRDDVPDYPYLAWEFMKEDLYGDFQIDASDVRALAESWLTSPASFDFNWLCDLDGNEWIDLRDFAAFSESWLAL